VEGLQTNIEVHFCAFSHTDDGVAEPFGYNDVERALAHLARTVHEVIHRKGEGGKDEVRHNRLS
jgi:succinate dehydrogenase/fumarate reductase flavoprotein subunit